MVLPIALLTSCSTSDNETLNHFENLIITSEGEVQGFVNPTLNDGTLVIKESYNGIIVKKIATKAFENNNLTSLTLPNSLTTIGDSAFRGNNLTSLTFGNSVTTIGYSAFKDNSLTSLIIPNSVTTIGGRAFQDNNLTSIELPDLLTTIGYSAFENNKLTSLTLPNSLTTIGEGAFYSNNLTSLTISDLVTTIGDNAFKFNQIIDRKNLTLPSKFDNPEELIRIGFNFTSLKEIPIMSNSLINAIVVNEFKIW